MVGPNLNFNVDVNKCFGGLWKSGRQPKTEIKKVKKEMEKVKAKRNDIRNKIEETRGDNSLASDEEVRQWQRDLELLEREVAAIFEDFTRINFRNNIKIGPWGVVGDSSFDIGRCASQITAVTLHFGDVIDSLEVSYVVDGKNVAARRLGGPGGHSRQTFELQHGEYIDTMAGSIGEYKGDKCISRLRFKTNFGKMHGPFGRGGSTNDFTVPVADGRIVGFFGSYGNYLKSIGVYLTFD